MSRATFARALWSSGVESHQRELDLIEKLIASYQEQLARALDGEHAFDGERAGLHQAAGLFNDCLAQLKIKVLPNGKVNVGGP